ncbi:MAG: Fic family protein [Holophaga sp.]|nr:Fic family protein [Holophaga sp.]
MAIPPFSDSLTRAILEALALHPEGLNRIQLQRLAGEEGIPDHQFRRILAGLQAKGALRSEGGTSNRKYYPALEAQAKASGWAYSGEGAKVISMVDCPLAARKPCSYDRSFLDRYQPNKTFYLREADLTSLAILGGTPDAQQAAGTYARKIMERLLIDLSWNSSRLEGNTYSLLDTEKLFREGEAPGGKNVLETQMILNHKQAIEFLVEGAGELTLSPRTVRSLHGMLSENLLADPREEGSLRESVVGIHDSAYFPLAVPAQIQEVFEQMLTTAQAIRNPFEQAFFLLVHLPYLQPFADVNKRTSRLAANLPLVQANLQPLSFVDLPREAYTLATLAVYEVRRTEALRDVFLWAYQRSAERYHAIRQSMGEPDPFRLRHREALRRWVRTSVQGLAQEKAWPALIPVFLEDAGIPAEDHARFRAAALQELRNLNEGTFARYGLRPSEFKRWKDAQRAEP